MRIKIFIYTFCLSCLIACDKDPVWEPVYSDDYISFTTPGVKLDISPDTRAKVDGSALPIGSTFAVWGYCRSYKVGSTSVLDDNSSESEWEVKKDRCPPLLFDSNTGGGVNNMLTVTVGDNGCTYTNDNSSLSYANGPKKWLTNENSRYTFVAVHPATANGLSYSFTDNVNAPKIIYSMPYSGEVKSDTYKNIPDVMVGMLKNHMKADGHVSLNLHHMLSLLSVRVNNYSEFEDGEGVATGKELKIHSIKLTGNFHKTLTVDMAQGGAYSFSDSYNATYVLYNGGDTGYTVEFHDDLETPINETSAVVGDPVLLMCGKPGVDDPYGPGSKDQTSGIKLILDYTFGDVRTTGKDFNLINPDLSFSPQVGVNYTFQLNWIGDGQVILVMPSSDSNWGDGEADDGKIDNDDVLFE